MAADRSATENLLEVLSYAISFGSFYLFVWVSRRYLSSPSFHRSAGPLSRLVHACVSEQLDPAEKMKQEAEEKDRSSKDKLTESFCYSAAHLSFCTLGIIFSYVLWGYMQERIMTKPYATGELFRSSKFLVFANRLLALLVAYIARDVQRRNGTNVSHTAPLYQFSFSSVSNIVSSVCQYEALKYISFPTQVLSKSCKMVPVMMMGYLVSRKVYPLSEYIIAIMVTGGVFLFKYYEVNDAPVKNTEFVGIAFITTYMVCDSFTSNWQSRVFKKYSVGSITMMMYANLFSSGFTALGLLVTWEIGEVIGYIMENPAIIYHIVIMAICSAVGQLFIFNTIKTVRFPKFPPPRWCLLDLSPFLLPCSVRSARLRNHSDTTAAHLDFQLDCPV